MRIIIEGNLPEHLGLAKTELKAAAKYFATRSATRARQVFQEVTLILQDDASSNDAHLAIMGVAGATDVITQRYDAMPPEPAGIYGELYVNAARALARETAAWPARQELLLYIAHGMDHLTGEDDADEAGYQRMRRRELGWLKAWKKESNPCKR